MGRAGRHPLHLRLHPASSRALRLRGAAAALNQPARLLPVRARHSLDNLARHSLPPRRRRPLHVAHRPHRLPRAARRAHLLARHRRPQEALLHPLPAAAGRDDGHLRLAQPLPLLRLLGDVAGPHDYPHRHLRPQRAAAAKPRSSTSSTPSSPPALLLVAMLWLYAQTGTFDLPSLAHLAAQHAISPNAAALWLASLAFLFAFAVKVPIFPLHGWLVGRRLRSAHRRRHGARRQDRPLLHPALLLRDLPRRSRTASRRC